MFNIFSSNSMILKSLNIFTGYSVEASFKFEKISLKISSLEIII